MACPVDVFDMERGLFGLSDDDYRGAKNGRK